MAARSTRGGLLGFLKSKPPKPNFKGTEAAFKVGDKVFDKTQGATPDLKRVMRLHFANVKTEA